MKNFFSFYLVIFCDTISPSFPFEDVQMLPLHNVWRNKFRSFDYQYFILVPAIDCQQKKWVVKRMLKKESKKNYFWRYLKKKKKKGVKVFSKEMELLYVFFF